VNPIDNTEWQPEDGGNYTPVPTDMPAITDEHLKRAMQRAMLWVGIFGVAMASVLLLVAGWQTAVLLLIGAAISATGLWEWQKLIGLVMARLDKREKAGGARVIVGFLLRLAIAAAVLYGSLKSLHGSVYALLGGLALAAIAMAIEATRLIRSSQV
jgi:hypothetical protein